jgi:hypothetical protein
MRERLLRRSRVASLELEPGTKKHVTRSDEVVETEICERF